MKEIGKKEERIHSDGRSPGPRISPQLPLIPSTNTKNVNGKLFDHIPTSLGALILSSFAFFLFSLSFKVLTCGFVLTYTCNARINRETIFPQIPPTFFFPYPLFSCTEQRRLKVQLKKLITKKSLSIYIKLILVKEHQFIINLEIFLSIISRKIFLKIVSYLFFL